MPHEDLSIPTLVSLFTRELWTQQQEQDQCDFIQRDNRLDFSNIHSSMDFTWIRPVRNPVHCQDVNELSYYADQVLRALERTYQPSYPGSVTVNQRQPPGAPLRQITRPFERMPSSSQVHNVQHSDEFHWPPSSREQSTEVVKGLEPSSRRLSDLSPHIDKMNLSKHQTNSKLHLSGFVSNDSAPTFVSKHNKNLRDEEQYEEFSDILAKNCVPEKGKENTLLYTHDKVNSSLDIFQDVDSDRSSPMSMFDVSEVLELNKSPKDGICSELKLRGNDNPDSQHDCACTEWNEIGKRGKYIPEECSDRMLIETSDDDISLYDSICSHISSSPEKLNASFSIDHSQERKLPAHFQEHQPEDNSKRRQDLCLLVSDKMYESMGRNNSPNEVCTLNEGPPCSSPIRKSSRSSSFTIFSSCLGWGSTHDDVGDLFNKKSDFSLVNFDSEGILTVPTEGCQPNENSGHQKDTQSPNNLKRNIPFGLKTPNTQRKFLGTPFQRALTSTSKSSKACFEGINPNSFEESFHEESLSEKNIQICSKSDENFSKESNKENDANSVTSTPPSKDRNLSFSITKKSLFVIEKENDSKSKKLYVPIFKSSSQSKRKAEESTLFATKGPEASCKKKLKFAVPYKQKEDRKESLNEPIHQLAEKLAKEIEDKMSFTPPQETCLTLLYKGGFCQLDRPKTCKAYNPERILMRIVWSEKVQYISVVLQPSSWCTSFLFKLLSNQTRKICFDAQEMVQLLVDVFGFNASEVPSKWLFLDPLIGCWLLNPDEPPHSFRDVLTFLKVTEKEDSNDIQALISSLSKSAQILYENLTNVGLWKLFLHIEMRISPILACMELLGIQVDVKKLKEMAEILKSRLDTAQKAAYEAAGRTFQLTSPQQLSAVLYEHLQLDTKHNIKVKETDKRHNKSTSESMLIKFKDLHPLPGIVLEFRRLHKHKSTYVDAVLGHVSGNCIYTTWDQISAATGRITSNEPNLQATPKQPLMPDLNLRSAYIARPGYSFLAADFQQIELRVFAHLSKDNALIKVLSQTTDVFKMLAQKWLQLGDISKVSDDDREKSKRIVYALMYGAGPSKLSEFLHIDYNQACSIFNTFSGSFPKMQHFSRSVLDQCRKQGYLATEAGRRRWFPNITSTNSQLRLYSERQAVNFLIQGTAADICKCAMVHTQRHLAATGTCKAARLLLQIHDELLWEVPDSDLSNVADIVQEAMEGATAVMQSLSSFSVSLPVVMKQGKTWGDMKAVKHASLGTASQQV